MLTAAIGTAFSLRENITLSAELDNSLSEEQKAEIEASLNKMEGVRKVEYVDKNTKIEDAEFRRMFAAEIEEILSENPLRNSFEVAVE
jgi:cell division transport system permease protein